MDKIIEDEVLGQKKRKITLFVITAVVVAVSGIWLLRTYLRPALSVSDITTSVAVIGNVENTINAMGEVLPEFEESLTSPITASVREVLLDAGNKVKAGQSVLILDKSSAQSEYDKLRFQMESKENEIRKLRLDLDKSFYDIKSSNSIKQLRISNLIDAVSSAKRLYKAGGGTKEGIEQAELNLKVAELEKQQLENEIRNKQQTMRIEIRESEIALAIQRSDLVALKRKLDLANVIATRDGVVTWINKNIGASIREGEALARIANLSSFKIAGTISDHQLDQLRINMPVMIRIGSEQLRGHVSNISPAINNNMVSFDIQLDQRNNKLLRPNMKVDVFLVTAVRNATVRVANGPAFKGSNLQDVFVLNQGKAIRRTVKIGLSNFDDVEILEGIKPGDMVITSDMSTYKNSEQISVNK